MPSIDDIYPSGAIRASDLQGRDVVLTIKDVNPKKFDDGTKLVVDFEGTEKHLVLNKTNARRIAEMHGDDYTRWFGRRVVICTETVDFRGQAHQSIRVRVTTSPAPPDPAPAPAPDPGGVDGDEIPF